VRATSGPPKIITLASHRTRAPKLAQSHNNVDTLSAAGQMKQYVDKGRCDAKHARVAAGETGPAFVAKQAALFAAIMPKERHILSILGHDYPREVRA
jgi:hypothetical protein